jgi:hypothetical protein
MITEFLPGNGSILVRSSAINCANSGFVKDPSTIFADMIPSNDKAGSREYLNEIIIYIILEICVWTLPSSSNKKTFPNSSLA